MPVYEYLCSECGATQTEVRMSEHRRKKVTCISCGAQCDFLPFPKRSARRARAVVLPPCCDTGATARRSSCRIVIDNGRIDNVGIVVRAPDNVHVEIRNG